MNKKIENKLIALAVIIAIISLAVGCKKPEPDDPTVVTTATPAPASDITDTVGLTEEPAATAAPIVTDVPGPADEPASEPTAAPSAEPTLPPASAEVSIDKVLQVYDEFLSSYFEDYLDYSDSGRFNLAFIDDDDIPELLIALSCSYESVSSVEVYRYTDEGKVQFVGFFGIGGTLPFISRKNILCSSVSVSSYQDTGYFEIGDDGTANLIAKLHVDYLPDETANYFINGEQTGSEDYYLFQDTIFNNENYEGFYFAESQPYDAFFRSDRPAVLSTMYETALNGLPYNGYIPENIDHLMGEWQLESYKAIDKTTFDSESFVPESSFRATLNSAYDFYYYFEDTLSGFDYVVENLADIMTYSDYQLAMDAPTEFFYSVSNDYGDPLAFITYYEDKNNQLWLELVLFTGDDVKADYHLFYTKIDEPVD